MGFFSKLASIAVGAGIGFALGGPVGAFAGGATALQTEAIINPVKPPELPGAPARTPDQRRENSAEIRIGDAADKVRSSRVSGSRGASGTRSPVAGLGRGSRSGLNI